MADYYEILGVPRSASGADIRKAYAAKAREQHPDRFADPEQKKQAESVFTEITAAFNALRDDRARREYDASLSRPQQAAPETIAADAYERGLARLEQRAFHEAVELLRAAVQLIPAEPRYHAALGLALAKNPNWVREGMQHLEQAIQLQPTRALFHAQLAELLMGQNLPLRARRAAESALRLDPNEPTARRVLEAVSQDEDPGPGEGGGGLRGLLRRRS
jgi:DnaJ-class molecular chaperone